jgi:hypothetical protein
MKPVVLSEPQWLLLKERLQQDHSRSVLMVRWKMKTVLGFTDRTHREWIGSYDDVSLQDRNAGNYGYRTSVHLDFFDENKRIFFLLKYSDYISRTSISN